MSNIFDPASEILPFFEMTPDLVCIADKEGFFRNINHSVIEKLGYTKDELFSRPIYTFIHPDDRNLTSLRRQELIDGEPLINFENRYITKSGSVVWLHWTSIYFSDRQIVLAIAKDITKRKLLEMELESKYIKFRNLASHFKTRMEKDKKYLAAELHEELAQLASVIKMDINVIKANADGLSAAASDRINHALSVTELMINTIRRITFSVSPGILHDLGLNETLHWLGKEFSLLNEISCDVKSNFNESSVSYDVKLDLFRICQESLTNILTHSSAGNVSIVVDQLPHEVCLSITDDGKGFDTNAVHPGAGIMSMQELAHSINANFKIDSELGKGTLVSVTLPLHNDQ
jgi:PAS domain S-box-containing protein